MVRRGADALDHALIPCEVIRQMVTVVKPDGWVILRHRPNEAETAAYKGLHQRNFEVRDGRFHIRSRETTRDIGMALHAVAEVSCHQDGPWLICTIVKRKAMQRVLCGLFGIGSRPRSVRA